MKILAIDGHYLAHRGWFAAQREADMKMRASLVSSFFLRDVEALLNRFGSDRTLFAFDSKKSKRAEIRASYKANRRNREESPEEKEAFRLFKVELVRLREEILPALGFNNIFRFEGYEGDDIVAKYCQTKSEFDNVVVATTDEDLLQCLQWPNVLYYSVQKEELVDRDAFLKKKGIDVDDYWKVKCLAGCNSDNVEGIPSIGEKRAVGYLLGTLKTKSKAYASAHANAKEFLEKNEILVRLPFPGTPKVELVEDGLVNEELKAELLGKAKIQQFRRKRMKGFAE